MLIRILIALAASSPVFLMPPATAASCDPKHFGDNAIGSASDTTQETPLTLFTWGSKIENYKGGVKATLLISNLSKNSLSLAWTKPAFNIPFGSPLGSGGVVCKIYGYGSAASDFTLDSDAPITTSNDSDKAAEAYIRPETPSNLIDFTLIRTELDSQGKPVDREINIKLEWSNEKGLQFHLNTTHSHLGIGFDSLKLSDETIVKTLSSAGVAFKDPQPILTKFTGQEMESLRVWPGQNIFEMSVPEGGTINFSDVPARKQVQLPVLLMTEDGAPIAAATLNFVPRGE